MNKKVQLLPLAIIIMGRKDKPWKKKMNNGETWSKEEKKQKEQKKLEDFDEEKIPMQ